MFIDSDSSACLRIQYFDFNIVVLSSYRNSSNEGKSNVCVVVVFLFNFDREVITKSVKLNSSTLPAGQIMVYLTMPQASFHLYAVWNSRTRLVLALLLCIAGV